MNLWLMMLGGGLLSLGAGTALVSCDVEDDDDDDHDDDDDDHDGYGDGDDDASGSGSGWTVLYIEKNLDHDDCDDEPNPETCCPSGFEYVGFGGGLNALCMQSGQRASYIIDYTAAGQNCSDFGDLDSSDSEIDLASCCREGFSAVGLASGVICLEDS